MKRYIFVPFWALSIISTVFICRACAKEQAPVNDAKYQRQIDSVGTLMKRHADSAQMFRGQVEALKLKLKANHKKVNDEIQHIKNFTPNRRLAWNDSVLRANGYR